MYTCIYEGWLALGVLSLGGEAARDAGRLAGETPVAGGDPPAGLGLGPFKV